MEEQRDRGRKEGDKWRRGRKVEELDNEMTYKEMMSIYGRDRKN